MRVLPIGDENGDRGLPPVTTLLVLSSALVWGALQGAGMEPRMTESLCEFAFVPHDLTASTPERMTGCAGTPPPWALALLAANFMHGSWLHLIGNMVFLFVFGRAVERELGSVRFGALYVGAGALAFGAHALANWGSLVPLVGASGAINGVMGAYIVMFPRVRVKLLVFLGILITTMEVPAFLALGYWFALDLVGAVKELHGVSGSVALWAHVGGFVFGVALAYLASRSR